MPSAFALSITSFSTFRFRGVTMASHVLQLRHTEDVDVPLHRDPDRVFGLIGNHVGKKVRHISCFDPLIQVYVTGQDLQVAAHLTSSRTVIFPRFLPSRAAQILFVVLLPAADCSFSMVGGSFRARSSISSARVFTRSLSLMTQSVSKAMPLMISSARALQFGEPQAPQSSPGRLVRDRVEPLHLYEGL